MAGVINKTERQIDLRGRRPGLRGEAAICRVSLNPGFNVVNDADLQLCLKNPLTQPLLDGGVIVMNALKTREDDLVAAEVAAREKQIHEMPRKPGVASLLPDDKGQKAADTDPLAL